MKKKLLSLLTSLMLICSLAAFIPQQNTVSALDDEQTCISSSADTEQTHELTGVEEGTYDGIRLVKLLDYKQDNKSDYKAGKDAPIDATPSGSFVSVTGSRYGYGELSKYSNGAKRQALYLAMYNVCLNLWNQNIDRTNQTYENYYIVSTVSFKSYGLSRNEAIQTYAVLRHDNPAFYFLPTQMVLYTDNEIALSVPSDYQSKTTRASIQSSIISYADSLRAKINDNYTDYYKAFVLNNTLVNTLTYAFESDGRTPSRAEWAHNIAGPALYKKGVCEAYAKVFQMVLNMSSVQNVYVIGKGNGGGHAWNLVKLDNGSYYCYDSTWNDTAKTSAYIARGTNFFNKEHTPFSASGATVNFLYNLPTIPAADYNGTKDQYRRNPATFTKKLEGVTYKNVSYGKGTLAWNAPAVADGVYIEMNQGGTYKQIAKVNKNIVAYTVNNLEPNTSYTFRLKTYFIYNGKEYVSDSPSTVTFKTTALPSNAAQLIRYADSDRYGTAVKISQAITGTNSKYVVIASGTSYADALAAVPLANALGAPILLTAKDSLDTKTLTEIKRRGADKIIVIGGTSVISENVVTHLKSTGSQVQRIAGADRFDTSTKIAALLDELRGKGPKMAFFVYYNNFADALSISSIAGSAAQPILYIKGTGELETYTKKYLSSLKTKLTIASVIGGPKVINTAAETNIAPYSTKQPTRIYGSNRYDTNSIINSMFAEIQTGAPCLATGLNFPDALAGGVFAAQNDSAIYLVDTTLTDVQVNTFKSLKPAKYYIFGGTGAVTTQAAYQAAAAAA